MSFVASHPSSNSLNSANGSVNGNNNNNICNNSHGRVIDDDLAIDLYRVD